MWWYRIKEKLEWMIIIGIMLIIAFVILFVMGAIAEWLLQPSGKDMKTLFEVIKSMIIHLSNLKLF